VATVSDTVAEQRSAALLNGRPVVGFEITRSRGAGEIDVADGVRAQLARLQAEHPHIRITEASKESKVTRSTSAPSKRQ
jgi:multidrug efflux pump subunit AcrB